MKQKYLIIPLLLAVIATPAMASENKKDVVGFRTELKAGIEARKTELKDLQKDAKVQIKEIKIKAGKHRVEALSAVYNKAIARLENIASRIDSRITKLETTENVNASTTAAAKLNVIAARTDIAEAKVHANAFVNINLTSSTTASTTIALAKIEATAIKNELKSAHKNLRMALAAVKDIERSLKTGDDKEEDEDENN